MNNLLRIKILAFVSVLLIAICPVHSQTTIPRHYTGVHPNQTFATRIDSIKQRLLGQQMQVHSKKIVSFNGQIVVELIQAWNNSSWVNSSKDSSTYDANGNLTSVVAKAWWDNAWGNSWQDNYTYDANGHETSILSQGWDGNDTSWFNYYQYIYAYDANGRETTSWDLEWNYSKLTNYYQSSYTYDSSGHETSQLDSVWSDGWYPEYQSFYIYDVHGNLTQVLEQYWSGSAWITSDLYSYVNDMSGNVISIVWQFWENGAWLNEIKKSYTYDGNGYETSYLIQDWYDSVWVNTDYYGYTYDSSGHLSVYLWQLGNPLTNYSQESYTYDANGNLLETLTQSWQILPVSMWLNSLKGTYTYQSVTAVKESPKLPNQFSLSQNYPNPFNPSTQISYTLAKASNITLTVYNVLGQQIATLVNCKNEPGEHSISWNALNVPSGVYFYRIVAGDFVQTKKMVVMK